MTPGTIRTLKIMNITKLSFPIVLGPTKGNILFPSSVMRKLCLEFKHTKIKPD